MLFDQPQIRAAFDDLVERGIILYGSESVVAVMDQSFQFEFRICPALATKPSTADAVENGAFEKVAKYGPGSDLADADPKLIISKIHDTHLLVLNRFAVFRPQYLVITLDSFRRQTENLDRTDLLAAWTVLQNLPDEHFIMFNCGNEAGCSRLHKHMQVIPCSPELALFPDQDDFDPDNIPFRQFLHRFAQPKDDIPDSLPQMYQELSEEAFQAWKSSTDTTLEYFPHNMMLTKRWIMVAPRCRAAIHGASANAAGMMGMVWVTNTQQLDKWKEQGPAKVLEQLGVSAHCSQTSRTTSSM